MIAAVTVEIWTDINGRKRLVRKVVPCPSGCHPQRVADQAGGELVDSSIADAKFALDSAPTGRVDLLG